MTKAFKLTFEANGRRAEVSGQTARALLALIEAGSQGVTALEVSTWAYRFAAYCHDLRKKHGMDIQTIHEKHPGGWHGRHILHTPVRILLVEAMERAG